VTAATEENQESSIKQQHGGIACGDEIIRFAF
jgi:hypothetical protein